MSGSTRGPLPPEFATVYVEDGWRGIERAYGANSLILRAWIAEAGGDELEAKRAARQACGRVSGSSAPKRVAQAEQTG